MILVVGAGPAGLAVAYELQRRAWPYQVLERHSIGYAWQNHYDRLHLHTLKEVSALPGLPMPPHYPAFPSAAQVQLYLEYYARYFRLNIATGVDVQAAAWVDGRWQLTTSQGQICGDHLVAATGIWSTPLRPVFPGEAAFGGPIIHSCDYRNAAPFRGQRVLVVGVGNSGSEIAVDLSANGVTTGIAVRGGALFVPQPRSALAMRLVAWLLRKLPPRLSELLLARLRRDFSAIGIPLPAGSPLDAYPVVGYELPQAIMAGQVTRYGALERFVPGGVVFADGQVAPFDAVILATGYRPSLQFVVQAIELDDRGRPRVDAYWRSLCQPHLSCVGFHYPTTEGWLQAIGRVARQAVIGIGNRRIEKSE